MERRNISAAEVEAVLTDYDTEYEGRNGTRVLIGGVGERRIKLVVGVGRFGEPRIITVAGKGEPV